MARLQGFYASRASISEKSAAMTVAIGSDTVKLMLSPKVERPDIWPGESISVSTDWQSGEVTAISTDGAETTMTFSQWDTEPKGEVIVVRLRRGKGRETVTLRIPLMLELSQSFRDGDPILLETAPSGEVSAVEAAQTPQPSPPPAPAPAASPPGQQKDGGLLRRWPGRFSELLS